MSTIIFVYHDEFSYCVGVGSSIYTIYVTMHSNSLIGTTYLLEIGLYQDIQTLLGRWCTFCVVGNSIQIYKHNSVAKTPSTLWLFELSWLLNPLLWLFLSNHTVWLLISLPLKRLPLLLLLDGEQSSSTQTPVQYQQTHTTLYKLSQKTTPHYLYWCSKSSLRDHSVIVYKTNTTLHMSHHSFCCSNEKNSVTWRIILQSQNLA